MKNKINVGNRSIIVVHLRQSGSGSGFLVMTFWLDVCHFNTLVIMCDDSFIWFRWWLFFPHSTCIWFEGKIVFRHLRPIFIHYFIIRIISFFCALLLLFLYIFFRSSFCDMFVVMSLNAFSPPLPLPFNYGSQYQIQDL